MVGMIRFAKWYHVQDIRQLGRTIPISKFSCKGIKEERVINRLITVEALKLVLRMNFLSIYIVFMNLQTKITISIPEKSSVASLERGSKLRQSMYISNLLLLVSAPSFFNLIKWNQKSGLKQRSILIQVYQLQSRIIIG